MFSERQHIKIYEFGQFRLDISVRQLFYKGKPVALSSRTFDILKILVENRGDTVMKNDLIRQVWPDLFIGENNLTVRVSALRKALGESAGNRFIETVPGYGYRFVARVRDIADKSGNLRKGGIDSLAVLPLINEDSQQKLDLLCNGITESLITSLSHISDLKVMAHSTVFRYKGQDINPQEVGRELGVLAVLVGKVTKVSKSLLFDIEMIDTGDGACLWRARYHRQTSDLFTLQEDVAREISAQLRTKLSKIEEHQITKRYTDSIRAYHLYLKGRYFLNKRSVPGLKKAIQSFRGATRQDPKYALAFVGLADAYFTLSGFGLRPARELIPKAKTAALKALELDDHLSEAHLALAAIKASYELDWQGAEREFRQAIDINRYNSLTHYYYSTYLARFHRLDEALAEINKAYEIDPLSLPINLAMGKIYYFAKRYDEAVRKGRELLEIEPQFGPANGLIGLAYLEMGLYQEAVLEFKAMIRFSVGDYIIERGDREELSEESANLPSSDPEATALIGYAYAVSGKRSKALQRLRELENLATKGYVQPHNLALINIGLGDKDKAFEWLDKALEDRCSPVTYIRVLPFFVKLSDDPRYGQLVHRIGL